jgi:UDP-N-acetylglucosamine 2-epimerase (non-hydrolysing)
MKVKLVHVVGARPNFIKVAPLYKAIEDRTRENSSVFIEQFLVHTGQHYSQNMSEIFLHDLGMPEPHINLNVGSGSHAFQTANIMLAFEKVVRDLNPGLVIVVGDINSTAACAITAKKMDIQVAHVEAGLRSFDRSMPEEINRILTDSISDFLFTTEVSANENLKREGVDSEKIFFVGNTMIDSLILQQKKAFQFNTLERIGLSKNGVGPIQYGLLTMHRPNNVDNSSILIKLLKTIRASADEIPIIFPAHPRTAKQVQRLNLGHLFISMDNLLDCKGGVALTEPFGYLDMLNLMRSALFVITDSGGVQEETTFLNVPCLTIRENTERPVTLEKGSNILVGQDTGRLYAETERIISGHAKKGIIPPLWDGRASKRIVDIILNHFLLTESR